MTPAHKIIAACGGVSRTAEIAECTPNYVRRWRLPADKGGGGGNVPVKAQRRILEAAARGEVAVVAADFFEVAQRENRNE